MVTMIRTAERWFDPTRLWVEVHGLESVHLLQFLLVGEDTDGDVTARGWAAYYQDEPDGAGECLGLAMDFGPHDLVRAAIKIAIAADREG